MASTDAIVGLLGVLVGALIGYWLSRQAKADADDQQARGLLIALRTEISRGTALFLEFERNHRGAPAWRLPTSTWAAALPFLAGLRVVNADEIAILARFFDTAIEFNYCLDDLATTNPDVHRVPSVGRAMVKVKRAVAAEAPSQQPLSAQALAAVDTALDRLPLASAWYKAHWQRLRVRFLH